MSDGDGEDLGQNPDSKSVESGSGLPGGEELHRKKPAGGLEPPGGKPTATRRPSPSPRKRSGRIRDQRQSTFSFWDDSSLASRRDQSGPDRKLDDRGKTQPGEQAAGGESGGTTYATNNYWSSTSYSSTNAWNVNFNNGNVNNNNKTNTNYVRAVRAGKCQPSPSPSLSPDFGSSSPSEREIFGLENIYTAYLKCRRRKRNTANALKYELNLEENLIELEQSLQNRTYRPGRSILFAATRPKLREIFAASFGDRVAHHILVAELQKYWEPRFIHDSCACREGRGIHGAVGRVQKFIRRVSANGTRPAFFLKLDIRNFFNSLNKEILYQIIESKISDSDLLWLARVILENDCTEDYLPRDREDLLSRVPPHKSLFSQPKHNGLPIGNLTSQFFANVYLDRLDQFVKHRLKCRYYIRYADDFVLMSRSSAELKTWEGEIERFLKERLELQLHPRRIGPVPVSNGVDFLGYIIRHNYVLVRRRVVNNMKTRLNWFQEKLVSPLGSDYIRYDYDYELLDQLFSCLNSYLGHCKWANSYQLLQSLWEEYAYLNRYFELELSTLTLKRRYPLPRIHKTLPAQYASIAEAFPDCLIFFQAGSFYVLYNQQAWRGKHYLGLKVIKGKGWSEWKAGFPVKAWKKYCLKTRDHQLSFARVDQRPAPAVGELRERLPSAAYYPFEWAVG